MTAKTFLRLTLLLLFASICPAQAAPPQPTSPDQTAADQSVVKDFNDRVQQYMDARQKAQPGSPPKSADAKKLIDYRNKLRASLLKGRANAKQGDVFTSDIANYFRRQIATALAGPDGKKIQVSMRRAEPVRIPIQVNGRYPQNVPLQSSPASLLLHLPPLPKELEYRVVDHALLLRDKDANLIVDFVPDAFTANLSSPAHTQSQP